MALDFSNILLLVKSEEIKSKKVFIPFSKRKKTFKKRVKKEKKAEQQKVKIEASPKEKDLFLNLWGKEQQENDVVIYYNEILSMVEYGAWFIIKNKDNLPENVFIPKEDIASIHSRTVYVSEVFAKARGLIDV